MTEAKIEPYITLSHHECIMLHELLLKLTMTLQGVHLDELISDYREHFSTTGYTFNGVITDRFVELIGREPIPTEVILLVERGIPYHGACCSVSNRRVLGFVKERDFHYRQALHDKEELIR